MTQSSKPSADHARHDRLVVVRYLDLDNDLIASEVAEARALLANCPDCAALADELQLITDATSRMVLPTRPRDFRLTPQQAASLRPGGLRRLLENAAGAFRLEFLRPLAGAAVAIGLLLVVVGALPQGASAPTADTVAGDASSARAGAVAAPTAGPFVPAATPASYFASQPSAAPAVFGTPVGPMAVQATAAPVAGATAKAATAPTISDTSDQPPPRPDASTGSGTPATGTTTALGPGGTPELAQVAPDQSNAGGAAPAVSGQHSTTISPALVGGLLLAGVGLLVLLLTFVARRIARSAG